MVTAPVRPAPPTAPSTSAPQTGTARPPMCQGELLEQGWSCCTHDPPTELCSSALHHSRALHPLEQRETDVSSKSPVVMDRRRALCSQPLAREHHTGAAGKHRELRGGVDLGWWVQPSAFLGAKSTTAMCWDSAPVLFLITATLSKSKSKGELWLHPYLWQSHLLGPTPPQEAWHHCKVCSCKDSP